MNPVAFSAYLSNTLYVAEGATLQFTDIDINIGNAYNNETSVFTAPQKGYYVFTLFFQIFGDADSDAAIFTNDKLLCTGDGAMRYDSAGCTAVTQLDQGDIVQVKVGSGDAHFFSGDMTRTTGFTGFLYHALD